MGQKITFTSTDTTGARQLAQAASQIRLKEAATTATTAAQYRKEESERGFAQNQSLSGQEFAQNRTLQSDSAGQSQALSGQEFAQNRTLQSDSAGQRQALSGQEFAQNRTLQSDSSNQRQVESRQGFEQSRTLQGDYLGSQEKREAAQTAARERMQQSGFGQDRDMASLRSNLKQREKSEDRTAAIAAFRNRR